MFSSPQSPRTVSEVPSADPAEVAPIPLWWVAVLRGIAATHMLAGTLVLALASALVVLFGLGPMVEVVWIAAGIAAGRP
jgi:hypothetical protein